MGVWLQWRRTITIQFKSRSFICIKYERHHSNALLDLGYPQSPHDMGLPQHPNYPNLGVGVGWGWGGQNFHFSIP